MKNWIWIVLVVAIALIIMNVAGNMNTDKNTPSTPAVSNTAAPSTGNEEPPISPNKQ